MLNTFMTPVLNAEDFEIAQNRLGSYISLSIWVVCLVFCFYYFAMGIEIQSLSILVGVSFVGMLASRLFQKNRNIMAVVLQCVCMYIALTCVLYFPVIGKYVIMCTLIITLTPIVLLNEMYSGIVFSNLVISLVLLCVTELTGEPELSVLEQILDFFIKFMVIIFVFVQVYGLRLLYEKRSRAQIR